MSDQSCESCRFFEDFRKLHLRTKGFCYWAAARELNRIKFPFWFRRQGWATHRTEGRECEAYEVR